MADQRKASLVRVVHLFYLRLGVDQPHEDGCDDLPLRSGDIDIRRPEDVVEEVDCFFGLSDVEELLHVVDADQ